VVTWRSDDTGDGDGDCIRGRLYSAKGDTLGDDFIVNTTSENDQVTPNVTALADGRFVVAFTSNDSEEGSGESIRAQIFDPTIFVGTPGQDTWTGGNLADQISGYDSNDTFTGLGGNDVISGDSGSDVLEGGLGSDRLFGGLGDDTFRISGTAGIGDAYFGGDGNDTLEVTGGGVATLAGFNAGASSIEQWQGNGQGVFGTSAGNVFNFSGLTSKTGLPFVDGAGGNDTITGSTLAETLRGSGGIDKLNGGGGNDILIGGAQRDVLTGGSGRDLFDFNSMSESRKGAARDVISHFQRKQDDIDLRSIDAKKGISGNQKFKWIGKQDFHDKKGELRYEDKGSKVIVQGDVNGDGKADFEIYVAAGALAKGDFVL
jgi:Ca2+-binding RTX toxin-like protein